MHEMIFEAHVEARQHLTIERRAIWPVQFNALLIQTVEDFDLYGLTVGDREQLVNPRLPAVAFRSTDGIRLLLDRVGMGTRIALRVHNLAVSGRCFNARLQMLPGLDTERP